MSYIIVLNPLILGSFAGDGPGAKADITGAVLGNPQVAAVTALVTGLMTLLFGLVAQLPVRHRDRGWASTPSSR